MQVLVSELITGGGWSGDEFPESLLREGRAMAAAVVGDFARIAGCRVVTTWDARLGSCPWSGACIVRGIGEERASFARLAAESDAVFVIAPETEGLLAERRDRVDAVGGKSLGPSRACIAVCSDKLATARLLERHAVPTVPTRPADFGTLPADEEYPLVLKPGDGAGSQFTYRVNDEAEFAHARDEIALLAGETRFVQQPYIEGAAVSVSVIVRDGGEIDLFPAGEQMLSRDGRFAYLGGRIPWEGRPSVCDAVSAVVARCCAALPEPSGYLGFDLVVPEGARGEPMVVDINPRLTTSYLGYRQLATSNLAERLLFPERGFAPIVWERGPVVFRAEGALLADGDSCHPPKRREQAFG